MTIVRPRLNGERESLASECRIADAGIDTRSRGLRRAPRERSVEEEAAGCRFPSSLAHSVVDAAIAFDVVAGAPPAGARLRSVSHQSIGLAM